MKYVKTRDGEIRTAPNKGHHRELAAEGEVSSAGRYKSGKGGKVKTYGKSHGFDVKPKKGDAARIKRHLVKDR